MILNNINNLIIMTENAAEAAAGDALWNGIKHAGKQFGRGMTDIFHAGKFNALDTARDNVKNLRSRIKNEASSSKIKDLENSAQSSLKSAEHFRTKLQNAVENNRTNRINQYLDAGFQHVDKSSLDRLAAADMKEKRKTLMREVLSHRKSVKDLNSQLDLPTSESGKLARTAGRATTGIAAGTAINAGISKLASSNDKEKSK